MYWNRRTTTNTANSIKNKNKKSKKKKNILEAEPNRLKRKRQIEERKQKRKSEWSDLRGRECRERRIKIRESNKRKGEIGTLTEAKGRLEWWIVKEDRREHCLHSSFVRCCYYYGKMLRFSYPLSSLRHAIHLFVSFLFL